MSAVYVVIVTNMLSEVEVCETYAGAHAALGRAFHLASARAANPNFVNASPEEEKLEDGTVRWAFLDTNKAFVGVFFKHIEAGLNSRNTRSDAVQAVPVQSDTCDCGHDHFADESEEDEPVPTLSELNQMVSSLDFEDLPAGWFYDGKPARMKDLKANPGLIKDPAYDLSDDEKTALIVARISKRCKIYKMVDGFSEVMGRAIDAVKEKSPLGLHIRDTEINFLHDYREEILDDLPF